MELVTGRKGSPHITSQQDRQKNQGTWGEDAYIMKTGNMLEPQVQSSNEIHIMDGALMFQGALFAVKVGTYDVVTINNGSQGMLRKDLIVARYTYDVAQNVESAEWVVIQGEPAESNPVLPTPTSGDIQTGSTTVDCPVFAVNLDGINVTGVDILPEYADTIPELMEAVAELNSNIETGGDPNEYRYYVRFKKEKLQICYGSFWATMALSQNGSGYTGVSNSIRNGSFAKEFSTVRSLIISRNSGDWATILSKSANSEEITQVVLGYWGGYTSREFAFDYVAIGTYTV